MPCDAKPIPYWKEKDGADKIVTSGGEVVPCSLDQITLDVEPTGTGYIPHWPTCPDADSHRRKPAGAAAPAAEQMTFEVI